MTIKRIDDILSGPHGKGDGSSPENAFSVMYFGRNAGESAYFPVPNIDQPVDIIFEPAADWTADGT